MAWARAQGHCSGGEEVRLSNDLLLYGHVSFVLFFNLDGEFCAVDEAEIVVVLRRVATMVKNKT
jgi:hypothetical protein